MVEQVEMSCVYQIFLETELEWDVLGAWHLKKKL